MHLRWPSEAISMPTWSEMPSLNEHCWERNFFVCVCQLSNFSLLFNMHSPLRPLKMQKKDNIVWEQSSEAVLGHFFRMCRPHHGPCVNTVLFVWNLVTPGGLRSWQSDCLSLQQCHWKMHLVQVLGFRNSELQSAVCYRARSRPAVDGTKMASFWELSRSWGSSAPSVHCLRKQLSSLPHLAKK